MGEFEKGGQGLCWWSKNISINLLINSSTSWLTIKRNESSYFQKVVCSCDSSSFFIKSNTHRIQRRSNKVKWNLKLIVPFLVPKKQVQTILVHSIGNLNSYIMLLKDLKLSTSNSRIYQIRGRKKQSLHARIHTKLGNEKRRRQRHRQRFGTSTLVITSAEYHSNSRKTSGIIIHQQNVIFNIFGRLDFHW